MTSERFQFQQFPSWFVCFRVLNKLCLGAEWGSINETISLAVYFYRNREEVRKNSETSIDFKIYLIMYRMVEVLHRKHLASKWHWLTSADAVNFIFDSTDLVHFSIDWIFNQVTQYECRQLFFRHCRLWICTSYLTCIFKFKCQFFLGKLLSNWSWKIAWGTEISVVHI